MENNEALIAQGEELTEEEIVAGIRKATIACKMTPVC